MTSKERVYNALNKKPVDRVPIYMWYHPGTSRRLAKLLEIPEQYVALALGDDIRQTWTHNNYAMENVPLEEGGFYEDEWGLVWTRQGDFNQIHKYPLDLAGEEEIQKYEFPFDRIDHLNAFMAPVIEERGEYFIGCDVSPSVFEMFWRLRGLERAMFDLIEKNKSILGLLDACTEFTIALANAAMKSYELDWVWTGDDAGSQDNMLISPEMWRDLIKPRLKAIFDVIKARNQIVAFHSCGAIRPIISDLVEIGIDVLNPIQPNCPGMNPYELKKEFGSDIAFMGGVDTQGIIPNGTATEVYRTTRELVEAMTADGGGYILAAAHTIPPETPDENIFALYDAVGISKEAVFDMAADIRQKMSARENNKT
jgi:uroporphyrinogen decarboxylase